MKNINIFNDTSFKRLPTNKAKKMLLKAAEDFNLNSFNVNVIYVDNKRIKKLNKEYLNHNYFTDVISFNFEEEEALTGEIYISIDKAREQADEYRVSLTNEIMRLAIHGFLHLIGHDDSTAEERKSMQELENKYLKENV